jgi:flagellum-specific ATP synthase
VREGILRRAIGLTLEASGCEAARRHLQDRSRDGGWVDAEVVGFAGDRST